MDAELKQILLSSFSFNPITGTITNCRKNVKSKHGWIVRTRNGKRYIQFSVNSKKVYGHVIAWLISYGDIAHGCIDHIDGDGTNNCLSNLRNVSLSTNQRNRQKAVNNTSGHTGVYFERRVHKWFGKLNLKDQGQIYTKCYSSKQEAIDARNALASKHNFTQR